MDRFSCPGGLKSFLIVVMNDILISVLEVEFWGMFLSKEFPWEMDQWLGQFLGVCLVFVC